MPEMKRPSMYDYYSGNIVPTVSRDRKRSRGTTTMPGTGEKMCVWPRHFDAERAIPEQNLPGGPVDVRKLLAALRTQKKRPLFKF